MANHQSLPHHGKPSPALSLMLKEFTERNLRRRGNNGRTPTKHQRNTKRIRREYEDNTRAPPKLPAGSWLATRILLPTAARPSLARPGQLERDLGAGAGFAFDAALAANLRQALPHVAQAVRPGILGRLVESEAIVLNRDQQAVVGGADAQPHFGR